MNDLAENIEKKKIASKKAISSGILLVVIGLIFITVGLCWAVFDRENSFGGGIFFAICSLFVLYFGLKSIICQLIYNKQPWKSERILLVKKVVPILEENMDELYDVFDIDSDEHASTKALHLEQLINMNDGIDRYVVKFNICGKLDREKFTLESVGKNKAISKICIYVSKSDKFIKNQLYAFDIMKFGVGLFMDMYEDDDFELLGNI